MPWIACSIRQPAKTRRRASACAVSLLIACLCICSLWRGTHGAVGAASHCTQGETCAGQCAGVEHGDNTEISTEADADADTDIVTPTIQIHSPQEGEELVGGYVTVTWEVTYFDIVQGYVEVLIDDQIVNTPLPIDPLSGVFLEPELTLDSQFGSNVPLENGPHRIRTELYNLQGRLLAWAGVNVTVSRSPTLAWPNYTLDGNAQSWGTLLNMAVLNREPLRDTFASFINSWPPPGSCGQNMRSVAGFPPPDSYTQRPLLVYVCPPDKCGGNLDWMRWDAEVARACGPRCLWVDRLPCHSVADVVLLSCYARPPPGFGKWPHQVWAYLCMESDSRRLLLSDNLLRHLDIVANYRLHPDFPRLTALQNTGGAHAAPWHVPVTYTPGNAALYAAAEADAWRRRPHLAAYLVSNCGRPRDLFAARLLAALGNSVHSYGRCFNNMPFPTSSEHGSLSLALLKQYKFTIAIENYYSHDYVSERFYQVLVYEALSY